MNKTTVKLSDDREVLLSYGTPVAGFFPGRGYLATDKKYSVTTSKHVTQYAGREVKRVSHDEFTVLVRPLVTR